MGYRYYYYRHQKRWDRYGATDATSPTTLALLSTPEMVLAVFFGSYGPTQLLPVSTLIIVSEMTLVSVAAEGISCSKKTDYYYPSDKVQNHQKPIDTYCSGIEVMDPLELAVECLSNLGLERYSCWKQYYINTKDTSILLLSIAHKHQYCQPLSTPISAG